MPTSRRMPAIPGMRARGPRTQVMRAGGPGETSMGTVNAELWPDKAPQTVANFLKYAADGFYDGLIFHRVISGFMIQGGGFTPDMKQKAAGAPIKNEARKDAPNKRGTLAMARTMVVDSATSQFFINHKDNDFLNYSGPSPDKIE